MKIIEKYFLVDNNGNEIELKCQVTSLTSSYDRKVDQARIEMIKIRDTEIQEELKKCTV
jgi:hypothetical protein